MQIRSFLGLAGYYHRFIPNFSKIDKPMTQLLEKEPKFKWSAQCEEAFLTLKKLLTTAPVLAQHDFEKPFDVYCDASGTGIGGVLMQMVVQLLTLRDSFDAMKIITPLMTQSSWLSFIPEKSEGTIYWVI
jgi:hypothetical protein